MNAFTAVIQQNTTRLSVSFTAPCRLSELLRQNGFLPEAPCGGRGTCGGCRVVATGALSPPTETERRVLTEAELSAHIRLACQAQAMGDVQVCVTAQTLSVVTEGISAWSAAEGEWGYGIAVDIGTTTLAAYLCDLSKGNCLQTVAADNPQRAFGGDVVTRMEKALDGDGAALQQAVTEAVGCLAAELCRKAAVSPSQIKRMVAVGNTVMLTLFIGASPKSLAVAPFVPEHTMDEVYPAAAFGWSDFSEMTVYLPPCPAAYIGADTVAALLSADEPFPSARVRLMADVGTNGELVLMTKDGLTACSAAAGPALEGAGIRCGCAAQNGAISHVALIGEQMECTVIGGGQATGLCGSGLLDAVAVLGTAGVLDREGRLHADGHDFSEQVQSVEGEPAFFLPNTAVYLTQSDIRAVQLAKAAIRAGLDTLITEAGLTADEVEELWLAGGFGSRLSVSSAAAVGLIPAELAGRTRAVGNAAGNGACRLLIHPKGAETARKVAQSIRVLTLNELPDFEPRYVSEMRFVRFPRPC